MDAQEFFKQMYFDIWQSNDLSKFDHYYARDFQEIIQFADDNKHPIEFNQLASTLLAEGIGKRASFKLNLQIDDLKAQTQVMRESKLVYPTARSEAKPKKNQSNLQTNDSKTQTRDRVISKNKSVCHTARGGVAHRSKKNKKKKG